MQQESTDVRLASVAADLREKQIDTKWCVLVVQVLLDGMNLRRGSTGSPRTEVKFNYT